MPQQQHQQADTAAAAQDAVRATIHALTALGRAELADAVRALESFAPAAAGWTVKRLAAIAAGDDAMLDQLDRNFEVLEADAILKLATAGVLAQSEGEKLVGTLLNLLGKFVVAATIAL